MKEDKKKILIIGYGYVGKAMARFFEKHYKVYIYDPEYSDDASSDKEYIDDKKFLESLEEHKKITIDMAVVCVPTQMLENGECDISIVEDTIKNLDVPLILLKSTSKPGTTKRLIEETGKNIVFSPEFIGESSYWSPYSFDRKVVETPWFIFGGDKKLCSKVIDFFMPITGPVKEYRITDATTAELVKYWENVFGALKVTFCNEMYDVCNTFGVDYNEARSLWLLDPRVNPMHTAVFPNKRGFGGKCLIGGTKLKKKDKFNNYNIDIEDVIVGDEIFDGDGFTKVTKKGKRTVKKTIKINAGGREIEGSYDHIHVVKGKGNNKKYEKTLAEITLDDSIFIPKQGEYKENSVCIGPKPNGYVKWWPEKEIIIDEDWARIIGLYIAEGCSSSNYSIIWSFGEDYEYLADEVKNILTKKGLVCNKKLQVTNGTYGESRCWMVRCRSCGLQMMFNQLRIGKNSHTKRLPKLNNKLLKIIIGGWLDGDGSIYNGSIDGTSVSKELITDVDEALVKLDICANIKEHKKNAYSIAISQRRDVDMVCSWTTRLKNIKEYKRKKSYKSPTVRKVKNGFWVKIRNIEYKDNKTTVYSIETESHLYLANGILTHNCFPKDINGLVTASEKKGYIPELLANVIKLNDKFVKKNGKQETTN